MEEQRAKLRSEEDEAFAKLSRLRKQIQRIEADQAKMVQQEVRNIEFLEKEEEKEKEAAASEASNDLPSFDVGEIDFSGWDPLTAGFDFGTAPTSQGS